MPQFNMEKFQADLKRHEGVVLHVYADPIHGESAATCGVGHLLKPGDKYYGMPTGTPITQEDMVTYLNSDSLQAHQDAQTLFGVTCFNQYPEEVQLVLANMMFNLGYSK